MESGACLGYSLQEVLFTEYFAFRGFFLGRQEVSTLLSLLNRGRA